MVDTSRGDLDGGGGHRALVLCAIKPGMAIYVSALSMLGGCYVFLYHWLTYRTPGWFAGYVFFLFLSGLYSVSSYARIVVGTLADSIRNVQYSTLATIIGGEELSLSRERRLCREREDEDRGPRVTSEEAADRETDLFFLPHAASENGRSFWCLLSVLLLTYNSFHLAAEPWDSAFPLLFSAPALISYFGIFRCAYILISR